MNNQAFPRFQRLASSVRRVLLPSASLSLPLLAALSLAILPAPSRAQAPASSQTPSGQTSSGQVPSVHQPSSAAAVAQPAPAAPAPPAPTSGPTPADNPFATATPAYAAPDLGAGQLGTGQYNNPAARVLNQSLASGDSLAGQTSAPPPAQADKLPPLPTPANVFPGVVEDQIGVTPKEIRSLHKEVDARQRAASEWVNPPKSVNTSISASLSPGSTPPIIRPFYGASTSFMIVDATGAPWPVENARNGNGALFEIDRLDGPQGSVFTVDALQPYGQSNIILKLKGEETPLVINLVAGQKTQDATVQVRVQGLGPNAQAPQGESMTPGTNADLMPVLDGVPPTGGARLDVQGAAGVSAWLMPDRTMILRSPYRLRSPFIDAIHSPDGTQVYRLPATTKILAEVAGQDVYLTIAGW